MNKIFENKKNSFLLIFYFIIGILTLTSCSSTKQKNIPLHKIGVQADSREEEKTLHIVCTTYPQYNWVQQILGENWDKAEVTYLLKSGVDIHSYQPSAEDMIAILDCDLFINIGGESEQWLEKALENNKNQEQKVISMMEVVNDRIWEEEWVDGMQKDCADTEEHTDSILEYDEHVWLSLKNAERICQEIADVLGELDLENQELYQKNMIAYQKQLQKLDAKYQELSDTTEQKILLVADRFPFRYLVEDYGWEYYAAFAGCAAETEASFETIAFLAEKVEEYQLPVIYHIETSDDSIANTVRNSTKEKNQKILVLDSLQAVTEKEIKEGVTYLSVMEQNLELLRQGFNN